MKKTFFICLAGLGLLNLSLSAQNKIDADELSTYHRSSLIVMPFVHMQDSFATEVANAALTMPFPDRYDQLQYFDNRENLLIKQDDHCNYKQVKDTA